MLDRILNKASTVGRGNNGLATTISKRSRRSGRSRYVGCGEATAKSQGPPDECKIYGRNGVWENSGGVSVRERSKVLGLLTVGRKHLYYWHRGGGTKQLDPLCVLDFYVSGRAQRAGYGFKLFEAMLAAEGREARSLAYDRPSPKMLPYLSKHNA